MSYTVIWIHSPSDSDQTWRLILLLLLLLLLLLSNSSHLTARMLSLTPCSSAGSPLLSSPLPSLIPSSTPSSLISTGQLGRNTINPHTHTHTLSLSLFLSLCARRAVSTGIGFSQSTTKSSQYMVRANRSALHLPSLFLACFFFYMVGSRSRSSRVKSSQVESRSSRVHTHIMHVHT
jgi:hypothetical protein